MKEILIRDIQFEDLEAVLAIEQATQLNPWNKETFKNLLKNNRGMVTVVENEIIGVVVFSCVANEAEILTISIAPAFQYKGYGRALLEYVISFLKDDGVNKIFLEVRSSNKAAIKLYESLGFQLISKRAGYYKAENGREDGLIYIRSLRRD